MGEGSDLSFPITSARQVLAEYDRLYQPLRLDSLGSAGGFSGARFWRVESAAGELCLRRWPREHPMRERLEQIHRVLRHAHSSGLLFVPAGCLGQPGKIGRRSRRVSLGADASGSPARQTTSNCLPWRNCSPR